jgi:hypothetical protein
VGATHRQATQGEISLGENKVASNSSGTPRREGFPKVKIEEVKSKIAEIYFMGFQLTAILPLINQLESRSMKNSKHPRTEKSNRVWLLPLF